MGQYEPRDSRKVTRSRHSALGEPPRTGPREGESRAPQQQQAGEAELYQDERGGEIEATVAIEQQQQQGSATHRRQARAQDNDMPSAPGDDPGHYDRND